MPLEPIVANLNIDMIGRNWADTIVAIGKEHSDLGATLERVNAAHPELRMTAIDDRWPEERFYFRSDHYNFARKGVPILFFFNGVHEDYHQLSDAPDKIDAEKEARILKLLYFLGQEIANAPQRPQWKPESQGEIVERGGAMTESLADFNAFRSRMNDLILDAGQSHDQPVLRPRPPGLRARRARHQDQGDARPGLLARAPLRRLRHLSRRSAATRRA